MKDGYRDVAWKTLDYLGALRLPLSDSITTAGLNKKVLQQTWPDNQIRNKSLTNFVLSLQS